MSLSQRTASVPNAFADLDENQQAELLRAPLHERMQQLSKLTNRPLKSVAEKISQEFGIPFVETFKVLENATKVLPLRLIHTYQCLPIQSDGGNASALHLVTVWPPSAEAVRWIEMACGKKTVWYLTYPQEVTDAIVRNFGVGSDSLDSKLAEEAQETKEVVEEDENAAIIRFVNEIIVKAVTERATDIHFEPQKNSLQIRYRIDGQLVPVRVPDNLVKVQAAVISRLKIMARLNISEKRRPQDGRIHFSSGPIELDIRVSTLPVMYGESVSLRLLTNSNRPVTIEELGMLERDVAVIDQNIHKPYGIILVTGPTGAGKSTSLSSFVRRIRTPDRRIITVEDPVEYEIEGINQSQVHSEIGFDFASALRCILRQDPDVIMVGEIRDKETADIAIRASLTGHLVLSSLHTNDAAGGLTRLVDMGIEPFLITASVEMILAQRLVRRLCPHCCKTAEIDPKKLESQMRQLGIPVSEMQYANLIKEPVGCDACRHTGYKGRVGIFELLSVTEPVREAMLKNKSAMEIKKIAVAEGMHTLLQNGWEQVKRGLTSWSALIHFAAIDLSEASTGVEGVDAAA
ncbi:MAG: type II/IV secretion system protein [Opitutales bacterium]|nr:type II/IV secretion system protein [Opitutales bacterium]